MQCPHQGAKNSTSIRDSGLTVDMKLDGVKLMTSESSAAAAKDAATKATTDVENDDQRIFAVVERVKGGCGRTPAQQTRSYKSFQLLLTCQSR